MFTRVTISGHVLTPDGTAPVSGRITAKLSTSGSTLDGGESVKVATETTADLGTGGVVSLALAPNDAITPSGTYYLVTFIVSLANGRRAQWAERWQLTSSDLTLDIGAVPRLDAVPGLSVAPFVVTADTSLTEVTAPDITGATATQPLADRFTDLASWAASPTVPAGVVADIQGQRQRAGGRASVNPLVYQSIPFDGVGAGAAPAGVTYTRGTSMYVPSGGVQVLCEGNELPFTDAGLLLERSFTNLFTTASLEAFGDAAWVKGQSGSTLPVVTANTYTAPNFRMVADQVDFGATAVAGDYSTLTQSFTVSTATEHTFSVWARRYTVGNRLWVTLWDGATTAYSGWADINTGLFRRVSVTASLTVGTWYAIIGPDARSFTGQTTVQAASSLHLWGAQVARVGAVGIKSFPLSFAPAGATSNGVVSWSNPVPSTATDWSFGLTVTPSGSVGAQTTSSGGRAWALVDSYILTAGTVAAANSWNLRSFTDGAIFFDIYDNAGTLKRIKATHGFADGSSHDIVVSNSGGTLGLYFDGVAVSGTVSGTGTGIITTQPATVATVATGSLGFSIRGWRACKTADGTKCGPAPERFLAIGDSITHGASLASSTTGLQLVRPWPHVYGDLTGRMVNNQGWSGDSTPYVGTRWAALRGQKEKIVAVMMGTNDMISGLSAASAFANLQVIYDQALADGQTVVAITVPPLSGSAGWTAGRQTQLEALNTLIRAYCSTRAPSLLCADAYYDLSDVATGQLRAEFDAGDHIHLTQAGANRLGALVAAVVP